MGKALAAAMGGAVLQEEPAGKKSSFRSRRQNRYWSRRLCGNSPRKPGTPCP